MGITRLLATAAVALAVTAAGAEPRFTKLTGAQIKTRLAGMEITDQSHWGEMFGPNGTLAITSMGHRSSGKWRVQGDQLCLDTGKAPGGGCYQVWLAGNSVELRQEGIALPLEGILQKPRAGR
jgi:hypothetical protein